MARHALLVRIFPGVKASLGTKYSCAAFQNHRRHLPSHPHQLSLSAMVPHLYQTQPSSRGSWRGGELAAACLQLAGNQESC